MQNTVQCTRISQLTKILEPVAYSVDTASETSLSDVTIVKSKLTPISSNSHSYADTRHELCHVLYYFPCL